MTLQKTGRLLTIRLLPGANRCGNTHISVNAACWLPTQDVYVECGPPTMIFASFGDIVPPPSLVVPSLGATNDVGSTTAAIFGVVISYGKQRTTWW